MLQLIDRFACWWMDYRMAQVVEALPDEQKEFGLKRANVEDGTLELLITSPSIVALADEAAALLDKNQAENFVTFEMMPRLDRGKRPITVIVQWAGRKSPARVIGELTERIRQLAGEHPT